MENACNFFTSILVNIEQTLLFVKMETSQQTSTFGTLKFSDNSKDFLINIRGLFNGGIHTPS